MYSLKKNLSILAIIFLCLSIYYTKNIKLDASSDTLILKNDNSFKYYEFYNQIMKLRDGLSPTGLEK